MTNVIKYDITTFFDKLRSFFREYHYTQLKNNDCTEKFQQNMKEFALFLKNQTIYELHESFNGHMLFQFRHQITTHLFSRTPEPTIQYGAPLREKLRIETFSILNKSHVAE